MKTKVVGFESANSFVKVVCDGESLIYPNTITKAPKETFNVSSDFSESNIYEFNGKRISVGGTVDYTSSSTDRIDRYSTPEYYIESIVALSHFVKSGDKVVAVTGIPTNHYYEKELATKFIKENLIGKHSFKRNGEDFKINVVDVLVLLQPLATFFYSVLDEWGKPNSDMIKRFRDSSTLVVDIGWGTTDIAHLINNGLQDFNVTKTSMQKVFQLILDELKDEAKVEGRKLTRARIELLDLEKQIRETSVYRYANEEYETEHIVKRICEETAHKVIMEASNLKSFDNFKTIIFTGGGTKLLAPYLEKLLTNPKTNELESNIFFINEPQITNAKGYFIFGKYLQQEVKI